MSSKVRNNKRKTDLQDKNFQFPETHEWVHNCLSETPVDMFGKVLHIQLQFEVNFSPEIGGHL